MTLVMKIRSNRWPHTDDYTFEWTEAGWLFEGPHPGKNEVDPEGNAVDERSSGVLEMMRNDAVFPSVMLPGALRMLWSDIKDGHITAEDAQEAANLLADWVNRTSEMHPGGYWRGKW